MPTTDGRTLDGVVLNEGFDDLQLRTDDKRVHLLRRSGDAVPAGHLRDRLADLQRRSRRQPLHDADADRQDERRAPGAGVDVRGAGRRQRCRCTPVVVDGIMYVTAPNECYALDAGSGRQHLALQAIADAGPDLRRQRTAASASPAIASSWSPTTPT